VRDAPESVRLPIICSPFGLQESVDDAVDVMFPVRFFSDQRCASLRFWIQSCVGISSGVIGIVRAGACPVGEGGLKRPAS
jgi:hypothetical protein